ncbi:SIR2 family protein [Clostridium baratii]|uniref:SIR2 family NAD-dependent protein deacylase n=1 Tax=Clostridium baratii TaxID=1561 RepID=UPI0028FF1C73|nr:SIR2 family protein [Clostridium baratii]MDU1053455.1 SIR2 family protein [Clostridium baratii]
MIEIESELQTKTIEDTKSEKLTKEQVFKKIFNAHKYGNLGMFIGSGFSKAVIGNDCVQKALNWHELIKKVSNELELKFPEDKDLVGVSFPELSTRLCKNLKIKRNIEYDEAKAIFKEKICHITNWLPKDKNIEIYKEIFDGINPNWIITTNYDQVLETILTGKCKSLNPRNYLSAQKGVIPIYHIHGTRIDRDSIIITQEDYIPLFRPNEYRQYKLAMTIRESTTLVLGYGLGDMNVLSALDWSKNIYTEKNEYPYAIIQVVWTESPDEYPYIDENDNIIIEYNDIRDFLEELVVFLKDNTKTYNKKLENINKLIGKLEEDEKMIEEFKNNRDFRFELLEYLSEYEYNIMAPYIEFFRRCIDNIWSETYTSFELYDTYLCILFDIILNYEFKKMPPRLFQIIAERLNKVLYYVGESKYKKYYGESWSATDTWHNHKKEIASDMILELYSYARENRLSNLRHFTEKLKDK